MYNENKVMLHKAECLMAENFLKDVSHLSVEDKLHRFVRRMQLKAFHCEIINDPKALEREQQSFADLPKVRDVDEKVIKENFVKVKQDVRDIYDDILQELENDPARAHLIVRKK